jgi:Family of unknown function (DUF6515)
MSTELRGSRYFRPDHQRSGPALIHAVARPGRAAMRLFSLLSATVLVACLNPTYVYAQGGEERRAEEQAEPYRKHHDMRHGHDHIYPDRGAIVRDLPHGTTVVNYAGVSYRFHDGVWFEPRGPAFVVVEPPIGLLVPTLPSFATPVTRGKETYLYVNNVYYQARPELGGYEVVNEPGDPTAPAKSAATSGAALAGATTAGAAAGAALTGATTSGPAIASATPPGAGAVTSGATTSGAGPAAGAISTSAPAGAAITAAVPAGTAAGQTSASPTSPSPNSAASPSSAALLAATPAVAAATAAPIAASASAPALAGSSTAIPISAATIGPATSPASSAPALAANPAAPPTVAPLAAPVATPTATQTTLATAATTLPAAASSSTPQGTKVFVYPKSGQNAEQQAHDRYDCYRFGVAQSGFDPMRASGGAQRSEQLSDYERAQAACLEGRGYTVR